MAKTQSRYAKKQSGYKASHERHAPRVMQCPYCNPNAPLARSSQRELTLAEQVGVELGTDEA